MSTKQGSNTENLREIERDIASVLIFSSDGRLLMGRKDPDKGGVYLNAWHIPGGGVEGGESLVEAAIREANQETGLKLASEQLTFVPIVGEGQTIKTLENGEKVWCKMKFNRFKVSLDVTAEGLSQKIRPGDDLVELRWFSSEELKDVEQIPGGREFFTKAGYVPS